MSFLILIPSAVYAESEINCEDRGKKFDGYMIESKANGYELTHKIYHPISSEEITLTLCWIVDNEIQVGKLITVDAKVSKAYPITNNSKHMITITFPNNLINYWIDHDENNVRQYAYNTSNKFICGCKSRFCVFLNKGHLNHDDAISDLLDVFHDLGVSVETASQ